jgi:hypothetical protein
MNKYSGLCDLRASAVNVFPLGFDSVSLASLMEIDFSSVVLCTQWCINYFAGDILTFFCGAAGR